MNSLKLLQNDIAKSIFNLTKDEAIAKNICIDCKQDITDRFYSEAGKREYLISGLCEHCWDRIFKPNSDGSDDY